MAGGSQVNGKLVAGAVPAQNGAEIVEKIGGQGNDVSSTYMHLFNAVRIQLNFRTSLCDSSSGALCIISFEKQPYSVQNVPSSESMLSSQIHMNSWPGLSTT